MSDGPVIHEIGVVHGGQTRRQYLEIAGGSPTRRGCVAIVAASTAFVAPSPASAAAVVTADQPDAERGRRRRAEAPPPLSKPPRLLRFVEATPPASLARSGRADVVLTIDVDDKGQVTDVAVAQSAGAGVRRRRRSRRRASSRSSRARRRASRCRCESRYSLPLRARSRRAPRRRPPTRRCAGGRRRTAPLRTGLVLRKGDRVADRRRVDVVATAPRAQRDRTTTGGSPSTRCRPARTRLQLRGPGTSPADTPVTFTPGKRLALTIHAEAQGALHLGRCAAGARWSRPSSRRLTGRGDQAHPGHAGRHAEGGAEPARRRARPVRHRPAAGVGIVARRHARLRRRRRHPDAVPLRRAALDGQQRDGRQR